MIELKLAESSFVSDICKKLSIKEQAGLKIYVAKEKDEVLGYCGFSFSKIEGTIEFLKVTEPALMMIEDGLLRASLSFMFDRGVKKVSCLNGINPKLLRRLGFSEVEGAFTLDLENSFLTKGCCCR